MLKLEIFTLRAYNPKSTFKFKEFWKAVPCKLQNLKLEHSNKHQEAYKKNAMQNVITWLS